MLLGQEVKGVLNQLTGITFVEAEVHDVHFLLNNVVEAELLVIPMIALKQNGL
jgi:hypothetical protein